MGYEPETVGELRDFDALHVYLEQELRRISNAFLGVDNIQLPTLHVAPDKPREGMVVLADGTDWNPGSGAGFYGYRSGAWTLLG